MKYQMNYSKSPVLWVIINNNKHLIINNNRKYSTIYNKITMKNKKNSIMIMKKNHKYFKNYTNQICAKIGLIIIKNRKNMRKN